jgi:hypothetical protein
MQLPRSSPVLGLDSRWCVRFPHFSARLYLIDRASDYQDIKHASIWSSDQVVGLGTFPDSTEDLTVGTGAFRDLIRAYPVPHRIERNYTPRVCDLLVQTPVNPVDLSVSCSRLRSNAFPGYLTCRKRRPTVRKRLRNGTRWSLASSGIIQLSRRMWTDFVPKGCIPPPTWCDRSLILKHGGRLIASSVQSIGGDVSDISHSPNGYFSSRRQTQPCFIALIHLVCYLSRSCFLPTARSARSIVGSVAGSRPPKRARDRRRREPRPHEFRSISYRKWCQGYREHCRVHVKPRSRR